MALPPFLLSGSINRVRSKSAAWRWSINRVKRMARHFTKHPHELNTFRLWAWERKPPGFQNPGRPHIVDSGHGVRKGVKVGV